MAKTRISKKSLAHFPTNIAIAIKEIKAQYKTASFEYYERKQGDSFYFAEGAKVRCFYSDDERSLKVVSSNTVGSNEYHVIGEKIYPNSGTTILSTEYFMGKYSLSIYNYN